jgi:uncharacterized membrane protein YkvI
LGKDLNKKQIKSIAIIVSLCLVCLITIIATCILTNDSIQIYAELPLLGMSFLISDGVGYFFSAIILLSTLTTFFSIQFSFHEKLKFKNKWAKFVLSALCFYGLSLFGFSELVKYCYPIIGGIGFIMFFYIKNVLESQNKNIFNSNFIN